MSSKTGFSSNEFNPTFLDIAIALLATFFLPIVSYFLFIKFGALIPLILYYGVFCYLIVYWRKGSFHYHKRFSLLTNYFIVFLVFELFLTLISTQTYTFTDDFNLFGFLVTLLVWAPINAFSEQLSWIYVYDVFDKLLNTKYGQRVGIVIGLIFYFSIIGLIHIFFWASFLFEAETLKVYPWSQLLLSGQFVVATGYLVVYKKSKSMWPVFFLHLVTDVTTVLLTGYSIIPDLLFLK